MGKQLSKSEIRDLNKEILELYGKEDFFSKKDTVSFDGDHLLKDNEVLFFKYQDKWVPTLKLLLKEDLLRKVTVDMGSVRFMTSGADVMRPGVTSIEDDIKEGDAVVIVDENHGKPLCVGIALFDTLAMREMNSGKIAKNIHYIGDEIWEN